jgi:signal transduction histidine kinase
MFRRVSLLIALQFTAFVFLLLLITGLIFLYTDIVNERHMQDSRMVQDLQFVLRSSVFRSDGAPLTLPATMRERVRVVDAEGQTLYSGTLFSEIPFSNKEGVSSQMIDDEHFIILTAPIKADGNLSGYIQIARPEQGRPNDLPPRVRTFAVISVAISALTFFVGLFFARRSLKPAEQMVERLEQFTQDASHELRTPLATLNSSLDLALKTGNHKEGIESAKEDVKRIEELTERLLELARLDTFVLPLERIDFSALVSESVEKHSFLAEKHGLKIQSSIASPVFVQGDAALLRQVLNNLLGNALKFKRPGSRTVQVTLTKNQLIVEDEGVGIAADALPHIFDRFYRADASRSTRGFGLGLALVKRIMDLHGWTLTVKSMQGKGTTFTITFPQAKRA